jgi:uncharacterized membrane protein HdeD (DUF308 family)
MLLTILFAKVLGLYMLIAGIAVLLRRRDILLAVGAFVEDKSARLITGLLTLLIGLFVVNLHNDWSTLPASLVTLFGWIAIIKGVAYLMLKEATLDKLVKYFYNRKWFVVDGILAVLLGLYLAGFGFGWF